MRYVCCRISIYGFFSALFFLSSACSLVIRGTNSNAVNLSSSCPGVTSALTARVQPVYPNHPNWNDYVTVGKAFSSNTGSNAYNQADTDCAGTENGYFKCVHGGEKKMVALPGCTSCSGLSATDSAGAFNWTCLLNSSGQATFYSSGLNTGMGLGNLISTSGAFNPLSVTVTSGNNTVATTSSSVWWNNPITVLSPSANPVSGSAAIPLTSSSSVGSIYVFNQNTTTSGYTVMTGNSKIGFVALPGVTVSYSGGTTGATTCVFAGTGFGGTETGILCLSHTNFGWIEGNFTTAGQASVSPFLVTFDNFTRVHLLNFIGSATTTVGMNVVASSSSYIDQVKISDTDTAGGIGGIRFDWSGVTSPDFNTLNNAVIANAFQGIVLDDSGTGNVIANVNVNNMTSHPISLVSSLGGAINLNIFVNTLSAGVGNNDNMVLAGSAGNVLSNTFLNTTLIGTEAGGNDAINVNTTNSNFFENTLVANNDQGIYFNGNPGNLTFNDTVVYGTNGADAISTGAGGSNGTNHFYGRLMMGSNVSGFNGTADDSSATITNGINLASSFVGLISAQDFANNTNANGIEAYSFTNDWLNFSNPFRYWQIQNGSGYMNVGSENPCTGGFCQIADARLSSSDAVLKNINGIFMANQPCPSSVDGSVAANIATAMGRTFLKYAVEVMPDDSGNSNGLCESGEKCIYSPNAGTYQGEGDYTTQTCIFNSGTISGVTMYGYPINGD